MGQIAFVFPGQGAQYPGMGLDLAEASPAAAAVFRMADALRPGTSEQCFGGSREALQETANTQPCLFTMELAAAAALKERGMEPAAAAGFSLGELAALTCAGAADFAVGFQLVCRRGTLMQEAAERNPASMAAVVKLDHETVEQLCSRFDGVYPVNYNCPGQVAVAGKAASMELFSAAVKAAGGRAIPLKVGGGFHAPFMEEAAAQFAPVLAAAPLKQPEIPLYSNVTGLPYDGDCRELLTRQICSPVRWEAIVRHMLAAGVDTFVEVGPGNTLGGLISRIDNSARVFGVSDRESLARCIAEGLTC